MSSESLPLTGAAAPSTDRWVRVLETLHSWVTTVDHKLSLIHI